MAKINILKDVEVVAEDLYKDIVKGNSFLAKNGPGGLAALGVLGAGVEKALTEVAAGAANPATLVIALPTDIADFKALWPEAKSVLAALGIKV